MAIVFHHEPRKLRAHESLDALRDGILITCLAGLGNVALIGDASGGVDAITGEGLSLSFHQAEALAEAMASNDLNKYQVAHRRFALRPAFMARVLLLLDGRTRVRRRMLRVFDKHPDVFERLVSIHVGETSPSHFAATGAQLGWRLLAC